MFLASTAACALLGQPVFVSMRLTCVFTVCRLTMSRSGDLGVAQPVPDQTQYVDRP
ncbi:hypothetical protein SRIMM317S_04985 [Streptomyces rimosus subsp. rimosus]